MAGNTNAPLTPESCDLREFPFMPLDVVRLRDSDISAISSGDEFRAAVLLWCASWHQVPAASLPDDDIILAQLSGYGRVVKEWRKVRDGSLRGWVKCSDGRLYHPVVAEKANEAWVRKLERSWNTECARIKKLNQRHDTEIRYPTLEEFLSPDYTPPKVVSVPPPSQGTKPPCPEGQSASVPTVSLGKQHRQGDGEDSGQGNNSKPISVSSVSDPAKDAPPQSTENTTRKGELCKKIRALGIQAAPHMTAWAEILPHHSDDEILAVAEIARERKPGDRINLAYLVPMLKDKGSTVNRVVESGPPWWSNDVLIVKEGQRIGISPRPGESMPEFKGRVSVKRAEFVETVPA